MKNTSLGRIVGGERERERERERESLTHIHTTFILHGCIKGDDYSTAEKSSRPKLQPEQVQATYT